MSANELFNSSIREAVAGDIPQIQIVRHSVNENILSDPGRVTDDDCADYLMRRGKGWVCEFNHEVVGFAIADLQENNIWALFVKPAFERRGIGRSLLRIMLDWYFSKTSRTVWLGTAPDTRAALFYKKAGWVHTGVNPNGEIRFEMNPNEWSLFRNKVFF
ncbi:MAG TPA: GNAT family N-acetyltransferase [Puia sp.]|jgi:ribosomal protein S18 acetylase RimI-like enzyme